MAPILLDISRTFARASLSAPTGIDRVEWAYFNWAAEQNALFLIRLPGRDVIATASTVRHALKTARTSLLGTLAKMNAAQSALLKATLLAPRPALPRGFTYLNVGHSNLKPRVLTKLRKLGMGRFVAMVHDTIPLDHPELCRVDQNQPALEKLRLISDHADGVIAVSAHSAERLAAHMRRVPEICVAHPGVDTGALPAGGTGADFVSLGTIEPRKNLRLLLDVWEQFDTSPSAPKLHIIGRRGWETADQLARLDRLKAQNPNVQEYNALDDIGVQTLLSRARALLFPSLAEGFGIPLYEARAAGLPVIASDLPVLHENGSALTTYLPPNDPAAWAEAILTTKSAPVRIAQPVPTWDAHFEKISAVLAPLPLERAS